MQRRRFLMASAAAPAAVAAADRIRTGLIGSGGRGRYLAEQFKEIGSEVAAVCDVYAPNLAAGLKSASTGATAYKDYRRLLENKSLEAVIVATPDHWHARMVIDAVQAGKDVYVEKPLCHEIPEGFDMVEATRRTKRIVQVGTQRRSAPLFIDAQRIAASGRLGDVRLVTSRWLNHQASLSNRELAGELDWQQWLGPAPKRELDQKRFFNWYYYWDYSGGLLVGQAAHVFDAIQWFMGSGAPLAVTCAAGRSALEGAEVPETASATLEFAENYIATFTIGYKAMRYHFHSDQMKQFHGSKARFDVARESYALYEENSKEMTLKPVLADDRPGSFTPSTRDHIRNFLDCIRTRNEPNAPVEAGLNTAIALCMTTESLRKERRVRWNAARRMMEG